ncbi:hypothetical protein RFI_40314 [Reticulomyxa filosa]|uniref:Uncharacterized protein n=1 Tax=Reticulomyxa filosa TaxID=46433 RepID=X6L854_RETFI|nr:hypothetical protein RFI_40314 [Reticulomyxa filosa]|eukprot:ETN97216.1 hypothetical protein RFI_40314 [Reticulomyxa filosa]
MEIEMNEKLNYCIEKFQRTPGDRCDLNAVKEVVEECLKCKCGIPQEILNRLEEESLKQKHETQVSQLQNIVQIFQELLEDQSIDSLLKECTQIVIHCDNRSDQSLDNNEKSDSIRKQKRPFRIYAFMAQTDQPVISFSHNQQSQFKKKKNGISLHFWFPFQWIFFNT